MRARAHKHTYTHTYIHTHTHTHTRTQTHTHKHTHTNTHTHTHTRTRTLTHTRACQHHRLQAAARAYIQEQRNLEARRRGSEGGEGTTVTLMTHALGSVASYLLYADLCTFR